MELKWDKLLGTTDVLRSVTRALRCSTQTQAA